MEQPRLSSEESDKECCYREKCITGRFAILYELDQLRIEHAFNFILFFQDISFGHLAEFFNVFFVYFFAQVSTHHPRNKKL